MGVFFESQSIVGPAKQVIHDALQKAAPQGQNLDKQAEQSAFQLAQQAGQGKPRVGSFITAALLLSAMAGFAVLAEANQMTTATAQLWTAFQTILGVVFGFLGGEATGIAS